MTVINNNDLIAANNSDMFTYLNRISRLSKDTKKRIESFIAESKEILLGPAHNTIRIKLSEYIGVLDNQISLCEDLIEIIKTANNGMIKYMGDDYFLDDSLIPDIEKEIISIKDKKRWLESYTTVEDTNTNQYKQVRNGSAAEISECNSVLEELESKLDKLKGLVPTDNLNFSNIENLLIRISGLNSDISNIHMPLFLGESKVVTISNIDGNNNSLDVCSYKINGYTVPGRLITPVSKKMEIYNLKGDLINENTITPWNISGNNKNSYCTLATIFNAYSNDRVTPDTIANEIKDLNIKEYASKNNYGYYENANIRNIDNILNAGGSALINTGDNNNPNLIGVIGKLETVNTTYGTKELYIVTDSNNEDVVSYYEKEELEKFNNDVCFIGPKNTNIDDNGNILERETF